VLYGEEHCHHGGHGSHRGSDAPPYRPSNHSGSFLIVDERTDRTTWLWLGFWHEAPFFFSISLLISVPYRHSDIKGPFLELITRQHQDCLLSWLLIGGRSSPLTSGQQKVSPSSGFKNSLALQWHLNGTYDITYGITYDITYGITFGIFVV